MKKSLIIAAIAVVSSAIFTSCNKEEKEISNDMSSGVVLIQNTSYYELELSNGSKVFFSGIDEDGDFENLVFDEDSVVKAYSYGTGFFVSKDGKIVTNNHVVSSTASEKQVHKNINDIIDALKTLAIERYTEMDEQVDNYRQECLIDYYNDFDMTEDKELYDYYVSERDECEAIFDALDDIIIRDSELRYHSEISIAYNDSYISGPFDFKSCAVRSKDKEHDLAIIQLKDKKTPVSKYIFEVPNDDPIKSYTWQEKFMAKTDKDKNSKMIMLGYNLGPVLAITNEGIKSQHTSGSISQEQDDRIMYSIPALQGSSGSPVVNQRGQLVAINYMGINGTQSFNYGIRVKHLRNLLN